MPSLQNNEFSLCTTVGGSQKVPLSNISFIVMGNKPQLLEDAAVFSVLIKVATNFGVSNWKIWSLEPCIWLLHIYFWGKEVKWVPYRYTQNLSRKTKKTTAI